MLRKFVLRNMTGVQQDGDMAAESFSLKTSAALGLHDQETNAALFGRFYQSYRHSYFGITSLKLAVLMFVSHSSVYLVSILQHMLYTD